MTAFVYVLGHDNDNIVKIGKADDVAVRVAGIQRMSPVKLNLLAEFDGGLPLEGALHRRFAPLRTHGEWFDFGELDAAAEITEAVADITRLRESPDDLDESDCEQGYGLDVVERLNVNLIAKAATDLAALQARTGYSKTDVINRALTLCEFIDAEMRDGRQVVLRGTDGSEQLVKIL